MDNDSYASGFWDRKFISGDWVENRERFLAASRAEAQVRHFCMPRNFSGVVLDFGCGLGDAIPVYRESFPRARFIGVDISLSAVADCRERFGALAAFIHGSWDAIPDVDVIVASSVFEHYPGDRDIVAGLLARCRELYVTVPYRENPPGPGHVNQYDERYYDGVGPSSCRVFAYRGWSEFGLARWYHIYLRNVVRLLRGEAIRHRRVQIMFRFKGRLLTTGRGAGGSSVG